MALKCTRHHTVKCYFKRRIVGTIFFYSTHTNISHFIKFPLPNEVSHVNVLILQYICTVNYASNYGGNLMILYIMENCLEQKSPTFVLHTDNVKSLQVGSQVNASL